MKKILTLAAALMLCGSLYAQIDPTVEVSRQYKVNIADIDRPLTSDHSVADSLQRFDVDFDYSIFNRPYTDLYEFTPYQTDSISKVERRRPPYVMAQFGAQFPFVADLQLKSQLFARPRFNVGVDLDGKASAADLDYLGEYDALNAVRIGGGVSANVKRAWKTGELTAVLGYNTRLYGDKYNGAELDHFYNDFAIDVSLGSANPQENSVFYNLDFNYINGAKRLLQETVIDTTFNNRKMSVKGTLGSSFGDHRIYVNMIYQNAIEGKGDQKQNVGILEFMPTYEYVLGRFKLRAGARFGNTYIGEDAATTIHPDVDVKVEVWKNILWIRGVVSGGNELNSLVEHFRNAPWLCNGIEGVTYGAEEVIGTKNLVCKLSLESIIAGRLALSPYIGYGNYSNQLQFRTKKTDDLLPYLLPEYCDYANTEIGIETSWKFKNLTVTGNVRHNNAFTGTNSPVYMVPEWEADASMEYNFKRRFFLNAAYTYRSERLSWDGTIPTYSDLTVVLTAVLNRHFAVYAKGGNLLNNKNYRYLDIPELPLNIGGGLRINF